MKKVHLYQHRHVFIDDEHVGKFDPLTRTVRMREEFASEKDDVRAFFLREKGLPLAGVLTGGESLPVIPPMPQFPEAINALKDPAKGVMTPAVLAWARLNWTSKEFARVYGESVEYGTGLEVVPPDELDEAAPSPRKAGRPKKNPEPVNDNE